MAARSLLLCLLVACGSPAPAPPPVAPPPPEPAPITAESLFEDGRFLGVAIGQPWTAPAGAERKGSVVSLGEVELAHHKGQAEVVLDEDRAVVVRVELQDAKKLYADLCKPFGGGSLMPMHTSSADGMDHHGDRGSCDGVAAGHALSLQLLDYGDSDEVSLFVSRPEP
ncbi:MAG: hypothetical protein EP330_07285 [Deltaproteobacteria bacterium]|nr:MAG: hypothetical protein EP330_07285 [Deltaproteobacteria bacterium]